MEFLKSALPWITVAFCVLALTFDRLKLNIKKGNNDSEEDTKDRGNYMCEGMCLGMCVGLALGTEWLSLGMLIGVALGMFIKK